MAFKTWTPSALPRPESFPKSERRPRPGETSRSYGRSSSWRRTWKATWTGSPRRRTSTPRTRRRGTRRASVTVSFLNWINCVLLSLSKADEWRMQTDSSAFKQCRMSLCLFDSERRRWGGKTIIHPSVVVFTIRPLMLCLSCIMKETFSVLRTNCSGSPNNTWLSSTITVCADRRFQVCEMTLKCWRISTNSHNRILCLVERDSIACCRLYTTHRYYRYHTQYLSPGGAVWFKRPFLR